MTTHNWYGKFTKKEIEKFKTNILGSTAWRDFESIADKVYDTMSELITAITTA